MLLLLTAKTEILAINHIHLISHLNQISQLLQKILY